MKTPKKGGRYKRLADGSVVPRDKAPAAAKQKKPAVSNNSSAESVTSGSKADSETPKEAD